MVGWRFSCEVWDWRGNLCSLGRMACRIWRRWGMMMTMWRFVNIDEVAC